MTGAWIFFGAQHPAATGGPINYSSPRLRRDGGDRTDEFATSFLRLISKTTEAKLRDTAELQKQLDEQCGLTDKIQKALDKSLEQMASEAAELAAFRLRFGEIQAAASEQRTST
ncbi:hypothetical protein BDZ97DRAFT_1675523 [Flammula alnicola]|nr:hypothetical protein BDZ97DRAFT_1675523 [Flammula alnicola]